MPVYHSLNLKKKIPRVVTLGVFDGIHLGHTKLIEQLCVKAKENNMTSTVITFDDHPHGTLSPAKRPPRLSPPEECIKRIQAIGVDEIILINFSRALADIRAESFVRQILLQKLHARQLVVGHDFRFGFQGQGDVSLLKKMAKKEKFALTVVTPLKRQHQIVSSSILRKKIAQGQIDLANQWLGWTYTIHGVVERGEGRGSQIGLPTANLRTTHEIVPAPGTYAVLAAIDQQQWPAICHIGNRPTFHRWGPETIETYIPGWHGRLYGKGLAIGFLKKLRNEKKFAGADHLIQQVVRDWRRAKSVWPKNLVLPVDDIEPLITQASRHVGEL
jgi:riboflavin kinase/FMN adenylyltransferase